MRFKWTINRDGGGRFADGDQGLAGSETLVREMPLAIPPVSNQVKALRGRLEMNTDRPGYDYRSFDLSAADPELSRDTCMSEARCKAWTYAKPGVRGPRARCFRKDNFPVAKTDTCCISGFNTYADGASLHGPARTK